MFYFLVLLGGGLILFGLQIRKKEKSHGGLPLKAMGAVEVNKPVDSSGLHELNDRIDQLQKLVFESLMAKEEHRLRDNMEIFEDKVKSIDEEMEEAEQFEKPVENRNNKEVKLPKIKPIPENIKAILEYENQGLSVQEIANQTHMNKGEVLLLQNLAKHYAK